jgi:hypothetical protein
MGKANLVIEHDMRLAAECRHRGMPSRAVFRVCSRETIAALIRISLRIQRASKGNSDDAAQDSHRTRRDYAGFSERRHGN